MLRINQKVARTPKRIGRYSILDTLGRGASGTVYKAYDPFVQRHVAIKFSTDLSQIEDRKARDQVLRGFFREAYAAGNLHHPNIVALYDAGMQGSHSYIVMEFVDGKTLKEYAKEQPNLPVSASVDVIMQCCDALDYAHAQGVIHRDIKPSNILITNDSTVKLADFSIAHVNRSDDVQSVGLTGSPMYMSPEVCREEQAGPQSDIYSLGVVMFKLFTGEVPFTPGNLHSVMYQIMNHTPKPITDIRPDLPLRLVEIVDKCLLKDPSHRYQYGYELKHDLHTYVSDLSFHEEKMADREKRKMLIKLSFFREFREDEIDEVHRLSTWLSYRPGEVITAEGDYENAFYVTALGAVDVIKNDVTVATIKTGECFGEMGVVNEETRSASIVAKSFVLLMKLTGKSLSDTSAQCQLRFYKEFSTTLAHRLSHSNDRVAELMSGVQEKADTKPAETAESKSSQSKTTAKSTTKKTGSSTRKKKTE